MPADLKASPQNPLLAPFARRLRSLQELAGQYQVDPRVPLVGGTGVDEMLGLPGAASLVEDVSYYGPRALIRGGNVATGGIGTFRPDPRITDVADVASLAAPIPAAGRAAARGTASAVNRAMLEGTGPLAKLIPEAARPAFVVKPKGGNWVTGGYNDPRKLIEPITRAADERIYMDFVRSNYNPLKANEFNSWLGEKILSDPRYKNNASLVSGFQAANEFLAERGQPLLPRDPVNSWLDKTLLKYIKNEMGTPEDRVRLGADAWAEQKAQLLAQKDTQIAAAQQSLEEARQARGFTPEMMTQSQARIRELQKERDFIAQQRGTHLQADNVVQNSLPAFNRQREGFPVENAASSNAGRGWENIADATIMRSPYRDQAPMYLGSSDSEKALREVGGQYAVENPEALAYNLDVGGMGDRLGFTHMADELRNAINPDSGLPPELLINPDKLAKMSVADVSRHVDKINAWRATQKAEANRAIAGNAATQVVKEYPEQGMRWVELRTKQKDVPEGYEYDASRGEYINLFDEGAQPFKSGVDEESVKALRDALKYEGEQLSHCVGGYCPDVEEGKSRIFSLRTEEGKPLTTIEMKPNPYLPSHEEALRYRPEAEQLVLRENPGIDLNDLDAQATVADVSAMLAKQNMPPVVNQIKGMRNAPPREQIDFVLDFLNERPDVRFTSYGKDDLSNIGIVDTDPKHGNWRRVLEDKSDREAYMSEQQINSTINDVMRAIMEYNPNTPRFIKREDLQKMLMDYDFAEGGLVSTDYNPAAIDRIVREFDAESSDYDYETAKRYKMGPDETGHWGSRVELGEEDLPEDMPKGTGLMLKGAGHETWDKALTGEEEAGYNVVKRGKRYYSVPKNFAEGGKVEPRSAWVKAGDTVVETGLRLYDKIADREKMPANQRIFLETFLDNKREPIDERAFSEGEMRAIRNLIGITGDKPQGSVQYEDYGRAGLNPANTANTGDIIETSKNPLESVRTTLGRFNYRRDPKTGKFIIEDQYDFNMPQTFKPNELGDYAFHPQMVANPFLALRVYAGSKMPQGTGRKVRVQVPFAEGGQFNQETVDAAVNKFYEEHYG